MVDHLTMWPIAKAIPNKEATTVANTIFKKLILEHGTPDVLLSNNGKKFTNDTLALCVRSSILNSILQVPTHPGQMGRWRTSITLWHGIRSRTSSYLHIGATLTHLQERHPITFCITETHHYQCIN